MNSVKSIGEQIAFQYGLTPKSQWRRQIEDALNVLSRKTDVSPAEIGQRALRDANVMRQVAGFLTIDESYFFRHQNHFDQLQRYLSNRLLNSDAPSKISILSAGCACGSEPYSLAIVLKERFEPRFLHRIEIAACDLDLRAIENARIGIFHQWAFRETEPLIKQLYFRRVSNDRYQLRDDVRAMVSFHHLSIQERLGMTAARSLDAIFFRNVGVYLVADAVAELYQTITKVLKPDGLLLVSATDPRPAIPELRAWVSEDTTVYRLVDDPSGVRTHPIGFDLNDKRTSHTPRGYRAKTARRGKPRRRTKPVLPVHDFCPNLTTARTLADRGDYGQALALCHQIINRQKECGEAHRLRGELRLLGHQPREALEDFERALSLEPDDPIYRFWYAIGLEAAGSFGTALGEIRRLIDRLASLPNTELLSDGETAVGELLLAATSLERNLE